MGRWGKEERNEAMNSFGCVVYVVLGAGKSKFRFNSSKIVILSSIEQNFRFSGYNIV